MRGKGAPNAPDANSATSMRLDMGTGTFTTGPTWLGRADFGLAAFGGKLYAIGGDPTGGGFFDASTEVDELDVSAWPAGAWVLSGPALPTARQGNQAGFSGSNTIWSVGGLFGPSCCTFINENTYRFQGCAPTNTPTVTGTPPTSTSTPTATFTPTATPTVCGGISVLIVHADGSGTPPNTLANQLRALPDVRLVDIFDADTGTSLAQLEQYDVVVPFSNFGYFDPVTLGNNLADYEDAHGAVVAFNFDWFGSTQSIAGRWSTGGYSPFLNPAKQTSSAAALLPAPSVRCAAV